MDKAKLCAHMVRHFKARSAAGLGRPLRCADAAEFLNELQRLCVRELRAGRRVSLSGIAMLVVQPQRPRVGRDPRTGERMVIPARRVVRARISALLRSAVEEPLRRSRSLDGIGPEEDNAGTGTR